MMRRGVILGFSLALALAGLSSCRPRTARTAKPFDYKKVVADAEKMLPGIRRHVEAMSRFGPRQTGQEGCNKTLEYVKSALAEATAGLDVEISEFSSDVTVPLDRTRPEQLGSADDSVSHLIVEGLGDRLERWPAYALMPNCAQPCATNPDEKPPADQDPHASPSDDHSERPRRVVDLGNGSWEAFEGKADDLAGAVVLLDFNSTDAWLRAASFGAWGAIFIEPEETNVFQADAKYRAALPLYFPRVYVDRAKALRLRKALAGGAEGLRVTLASRMRFENVKARCLELTIPGRRRDYCFVLAGHVDARSIVPDLSYGQSELWGIAELLELTRHYAANQPECDLRIIFVSGHWQSQRTMRDHVAYGGENFARVGKYFKIAMGVDLDPEGRSVNMLCESSWDLISRESYAWLGAEVFSKGAWRDQIVEGLGLGSQGVELLGATRPTMQITADTFMGSHRDRSPMIHVPRYRTAEEAWQALSMPTFAFQTGRLRRLRHFTPLDKLAVLPSKAIDDNLRPQLQLTLAMLARLMDYPPDMMPSRIPRPRGRRTIGGWACVKGTIQEWDRSIGWFAQRLPSDGDGKQLKTFIHCTPVDSVVRALVGPRLRNYQQWPTTPDRGQHRQLQSFMFQDLLLQETPSFRINTVYAAHPETQYIVVAYSLDESGRIRQATDFGNHGDSNKSFQCTDLDLDTAFLNVPVGLFECGTVELFDLVDPQRYDPSARIAGTFAYRYRAHSDHADIGVAPHLKITGVKDVDTHTDLDRWGFTQYGPTAMVFLPADFITGAEILLGKWHTNFAVLNNPDEKGDADGFRVHAGQTVRPAGGGVSTPRACLQQLTALNVKRLTEFAAHDVVSPLAKQYHQDSVDALALADKARADGKLEVARAHTHRAWIFESLAYRNTLALLVDVVSTTVLYFVLLIPFSFLVERLMFPQRTPLRTAIVSVLIFIVFAAILYLFHPGFKLANNVTVTVTAFVIVVMTIPALILLLVRGVAMLRAIGSKAIITQRSEAEGAGVVMASLSMAVSNMRRRRLRTALTLVTITTLVMALVLLTTSSAFDFKILDPSGTSGAGFEGIQIFNTTDRRLPLLMEMVEVQEAALRDQALVLRRESVTYGYDHKGKQAVMHLQAGPARDLAEAGVRRVEMPFFQVMDYRDNLLEYELREGKLSRKVHLSDLMRGEFLAPGDRDVCLLPDTMANKLGVDVGDMVNFMGLSLRVKGIWIAQTRRIQIRDGKREEIIGSGPLDHLVDLDGLPMTTLNWSNTRGSEPDNPPHALSREIVIVPREWVRHHGIFVSNVHSLIVVPTDSEGLPDPDRIGPMSARLAKEVLNVDVFSHRIDPATGQGETQRVSMHTATHVKGSSMMLVVLGAAVLMILAIMTGTVYERMREIHIFSSVGLSPRHVAGMFLIEALVYAGISAVLGYFLGIVALKGLLAYLKANNQAQEFYPNYLGVFVLYSIGMAVLATVASSLYPIRLASKIVNPAGGRKWQSENRTGLRGEPWTIRLPFIATTWREAQAMMAYAHDYLAMHQGERSGRFVCERPPKGWTEGTSLLLEMPVWLAPFERNLSQHALLRTAEAPDAAWWVMTLELRRVSGPDYLWERGATVFIDMLCKHLLRWRAATPEQEQQYVEIAEKTFASSA